MLVKFAVNQQIFDPLSMEKSKLINIFLAHPKWVYKFSDLFSLQVKRSLMPGFKCKPGIQIKVTMHCSSQIVFDLKDL